LSIGTPQMEQNLLPSGVAHFHPYPALTMLTERQTGQQVNGVAICVVPIIPNASFHS